MKNVMTQPTENGYNEAQQIRKAPRANGEPFGMHGGATPRIQLLMSTTILELWRPCAQPLRGLFSCVDTKNTASKLDKEAMAPYTMGKKSRFVPTPK